MAKKIKKITPKKSTTTRKPKKFGKNKFFTWYNFLKLFSIIFVYMFVTSLSAVFFYKWVDPPFTYLMAKRQISAWVNRQKTAVKYEFVSDKKISNYLKLAVIAAEDQKFLTHNGFDFVSIAKTMEINKTSKLVKGASTITQQVAKNVFLWDSRNFVRKGLEVYFSFLIELIWGKKRILEVYLNIAEMAPMTFGAEQASRRYFNKSAKKLSPDQAASLAAVLPNPIKYSVSNPSKYLLKRKLWILQQMNNLGGPNFIDEIK